MKVFNSLTNRKEELHDNSTPVTMYTCGPTVYYYPHIGNMRAYLFMDFLRKTLHFLGYKTNSVMNLTDVGHLTSDEDEGEDKMEVAASREKKTPEQIAEFYTNCFFEDFKALNIEKPEHIVKATEHISQMIDFIKELEKKGFTYKIDDGIYFDVQKFSHYGALSNKDLSKVGVNRIDENSQKRHPFDFALWKFVPKEHIMKWDSPWGVGCPGWHIECSAMGTYYLGNKIDIHTGGVDHKTVHHENEIAQNDCMMGHQVVDKWMHVEFLQVDGGKMSKSLNNIYTINQLVEKGYSPLDFRYLNLLTHYRKSLNFTFEALNSAKSALKSLKNIVLEHKNSNNHINAQNLEIYKQEFSEAIADDLNMPLALGTLWKMVKDMERSVEVYQMAMEFDKVLSLNLGQEDEIPEEIVKLANQRLEARKNKDWALSDSLRDEIAKLGYQIKDSKDGYEINKI
ncbi:MAG: cysteine--tRNA ligase [Firmicutes bacterium]|nr:cysteine--tRNA ligase [Bacillota bacterium]